MNTSGTLITSSELTKNGERIVIELFTSDGDELLLPRSSGRLVTVRYRQETCLLSDRGYSHRSEVLLAM